MRSDPLQLLDSILQNADHSFRAAQRPEPFCRRLGLCRLDRQEDEVDGAPELCGIHPDRTGNGDEAFAILKRQAIAGCAAAQQRGATDFVQCRRDRGADGTRAHDGDGCSACCLHEHRLLRPSRSAFVHASLALFKSAL